MWTRDTLGPIEARAIIRHAYGCFYNDFSNVDLQGKRFVPQLTYHRFLRGFRSAVLRYGEGIRRFHLSRRYSGKNCQLSDVDRNCFPGLIQIEPQTASPTLSYSSVLDSIFL